MKYSMAPAVPRYDFPLHKGKLAAFGAMLAFMIAVLVGRALTGTLTLGETGAVALLVLMLGGYLAFALVPYFRHRAPIVQVTPEGLIDLRKSPDPLPWADIKLVEIKRLSVGPGLKIELESGGRHDVDFHLLEGRAEQAFLAMRDYLYNGEDEDLAD